jgi:hypothetical protein
VNFLGIAPQIYCADRYGAAPNTATIQRKMGVPIDSPVRALFDYGEMAGPNFRDHPPRLYWLDRDASVIELR